MSDLDPVPPLKSLKDVREWMKNASRELLDAEEFERARTILDLLQRTKELEDALLSAFDLSREQLRPEDRKGSSRRDKVVSGGNADKMSNGDGYPCFLVRGNNLIKLGKTRGGSDVYEQRLPRIEFDRILDSLRQICLKKAEFDIRDVLALAPVPNYQAYLLLGALQELGLLQVPRRGMYSFVDPRHFSVEANSAWQQLAARSREKGGD